MTSIIQSNRERKSRLDEGLVERLNNRKAGASDTSKNEGQEIQIYYIGPENRPQITLRRRKTIVRAQTQTEYDNLMQICEVAEMLWPESQRPTTQNSFDIYGPDTCINMDDSTICYQSCAYYTKERKEKFIGYRIYGNVQEFLSECRLEEPLKQINEWFNKNKPDRKSKG